MAAPIVSQPVKSVIDQHEHGAAISSPVGAPNCPPDLNFLSTVDKLLVYQSVDYVEVLTNKVRPNVYTIKSALGEAICSAEEETEFRQWIGCFVIQRFDLTIFDKSKKIILSFKYPMRCQPCCIKECIQKLEVSDSTGDVIGYIVEDLTFWTNKLIIKNRNDETVLNIVGESALFATCGFATTFKIFDINSKEIGQIKKLWAGVVQEMITDADNFTINFPVDLDVHTKATLLGALFLIDYMYFESPPLNLFGPLSSVIPCVSSSD